LHREDGALTNLEDAEIGTPPFIFGTKSYGFLDDGRIACVVTRAAIDSLELLDPETGTLERAGLRWTAFSPSTFAADGTRIAFAGTSPNDPATVALWDAATGEETVIRRIFDLDQIGRASCRERAWRSPV